MNSRVRRTGRSRRSAGMTLIELVVVMVIISAAALVAYPAIRSGVNQRQVRQTLQHFVAAVRRASSMAILRRETVEIWVWPDRKEYALVTRERRSRKARSDDDEEESRRASLQSRGMVGRNDGADEGVGAGRSIVGKVALPEIASFGEVEGGRFVAAEITSGGYTDQEAILFEFYPTGSSSGGRVEFEFDVPRDRLQYQLVIDPLVSSISMEE